MTGNRGLWAAAVAAALLGIALLLPRHHLGTPAAAPLPGRTSVPANSPVPGGPAPRPTRSAAPAGAASPSASIFPAGEPGGPAADAQWRPVATGFARDFADPGTGHADWLARVRRWTTPYLAAQYQRTDPYRIPAATLTAVKPIAVGATTVSYVASYDNGLTLACRVELGPTGWKVTGAQPPAPGAPGSGG